MKRLLTWSLIVITAIAFSLMGVNTTIQLLKAVVAGKIEVVSFDFVFMAFILMIFLRLAVFLIRLPKNGEPIQEWQMRVGGVYLKKGEIRNGQNSYFVLLERRKLSGAARTITTPRLYELRSSPPDRPFLYAGSNRFVEVIPPPTESDKVGAVKPATA